MYHLNEKGGSQDILDAAQRGELFPIFFSSGITRQNELAITKAFNKLQSRQDLVSICRPRLEAVRSDVVDAILEQGQHRDDAREQTKDASLSPQEKNSFFAIAAEAAAEFPGCQICVCDSYRTVDDPPAERTRSAAVIWAGFSKDSWSRRFAKLKTLSVDPFILVGVTGDEIEQNKFLGITSRIKSRPDLRFDTSTKRYLEPQK